MSVLYDSQFESQLGPQTDDAAVFVRAEMGSLNAAAHARVVNRTHRVVRERAQVMQARRSHVRSLMVPLVLCSALLALAVAAVWTGMYQFQASEAADALPNDVAALDANNHLLVALLWFVPVSLALLAAMWGRHLKNGRSESTR